MSIRIELLVPAEEAAYEEFLHSVPYSLLYMSLAYRNFLARILPESQARYLVAYETGRIVGILPTFLRTNAHYGNVLNSLPFYGSNGGLIVAPQIANGEQVAVALMQAFHSLAVEASVVVSTLISHPLAPRHDFYATHSRFTLLDERIGQITPLPVSWGSSEELQERLMASFHQKTRNSVRKAQKSGLLVGHSAALETLQTVAELHRQNIESVGGLAKSWSAFKAIHETFAYDQEYRVYFAELDGVIIAALLVFFYNQTAEYYTPATLETHRNYQPMSLLIFEAMQEAARRGCRHWNWGGTWLTQGGVYQFKSRWGTQDHPYTYYIREYDGSEQLRHLSAGEILLHYPYYYVLPFNVLGGKANG